MMNTSYFNDLLSKKIYWLNKLSGELPETNLMLDFVRPLVSSTKKKSLSFGLSNDLSEAMIKLTKGSYFSTYWILVSALNILLQKYTRNNDVIVGIPIYEQMGTDCISSKVIPLRTQVEPQLLCKDYILAVKDEILGAFNNQNYNFDEFIQLLYLPILPNRYPIFDIIILLENIHDRRYFDQLNNDITISFKVNSEGIDGYIDYKENLFKDKNIKLVSRYYVNVIESLLKNLDVKISDIALLKDTDKHQLLTKFNNNTKEYPIEQTINQLFEQQVAKTPNKIAVLYKSNKLTYQELNQKANQLARLLRKLGITKGEFVGIFKPRDLNFLVAIIAIYKAGGAYVPIDSTYPSNRIQYMLSNSNVRFLLTDFSLLNILEDLVGDCENLESIICLDEVVSKHLQFANHPNLKIYNKVHYYQLPHDNIEHINNAVDPAYMLYTSGSTGLPKGAIVRHDGAINHIYAQFDELELTEEFCFLQSAPSSTDISVWQFLAPILIGGNTVIVDIETVAVPEQLFKVLKAEKITVVELVPTLFGGLLEYTSQLPNDERVLPDLKWMMLSGESVSIKWVNKWLEMYPEINIVNAYGPTEAADDIAQLIVDKPFPDNQRTVPIGKPLANLNLYILDQDMQLLPIGVPGEICVSGIGVGNGYWKNEERTKLSFVPNPFTDAQKNLPENRRDLIYKTGDLGRWLFDGNIEFLGRIDHQVKIRGFRVELGEIEAFLGQHPLVRDNIVLVQQEEAGNAQLIAYVVAKTEVVPSINELRSFLKEKLPDHMIPSIFVMLENLPLAPSGKVDRKALPQPDNLRPELETAYVSPRNDIERAVAEIWQKILKVEKVGIQDNFFDLGGHSLNMLQVYSKLRELFKADLAITDLFKYPTINSISRYLSQEEDENNFNQQSHELNEELEVGKTRLRQRFLRNQQQNI
jgi:amino acid adenylation domain-containing protein